MLEVAPPRKKTYKREYALGLTLFWAYLCLQAIDSDEAMEVVRMITWPVLGLSAGAFGLDWKAKQERE